MRSDLVLTMRDNQTTAVILKLSDVVCNRTHIICEFCFIRTCYKEKIHSRYR